MEDAHIAEGELYALELDANSSSGGKGTKIPLEGHSLFAVYDGHGGTFAAIYSGSNFLRILSKQPKFVKYAKMCASGPTDDSNRAAKMRILEQALKQAFVETDYEIGLAIRGKSHADANSPYHDPPKASAGSGATIDSNPSDENSDDEAAANPNDAQQNNAAAAAAGGGNAPNNKPAMAGAAMKAASDHLSAIEDEGDSGTTSCVVVITPDSIVCANAGDSRAVFARRPETSMAASKNLNSGSNSNSLNNSTSNALATSVGKAIPLSFDHKPDDEEEEKRVRNAGGYVTGGRVEGDLAVSRGLGDFRFKQMSVVLNNTQLYAEEEATTTTMKGDNNHDMKTDDEGDVASDDAHNIPLNDSMLSKPLEFPPGEQKVSPIPDVTIHMRNQERDEYVVVACDGIWDVVSNQQCIMELDEIMYAEGERDLGLVSEEILDTCLRYGSKDNMTAIVVQLTGCEKSYDEASKAVSDKADGGDSSQASSKQEGVAGRRRKREEAMNAAQQQQTEAEHQNYAGAAPYGVSAPE